MGGVRVLPPYSRTCGVPPSASSLVASSPDSGPTRRATGWPLRGPPRRRAPAAARRRSGSGASVQGRADPSRSRGQPARARKVLVVGAVHGNEPAGRAVMPRACAASRPPRGTALWLVEDLNPDGAAASTRQNAARGGPEPQLPATAGGRRPPFDTYHSGPRRCRSPSRARSRASSSACSPRVTLWYHQALGSSCARDGRPGARAALRRARRAARAGACRATTARPRLAEPHASRGDTAFVVELPGGSLSARRGAPPRRGRSRACPRGGARSP